jgi:single-strand DNA-binding protein
VCSGQKEGLTIQICDRDVHVDPWNIGQNLAKVGLDLWVYTGSFAIPKAARRSTMTVNKVILIGNLGQDPELRSTGSGTPVLNLRIATSERVRDGQDGWKDQTEWHNVVVFGRTAENVARFKKKGESVYIEGRLQTRKWKDRSGADRWSTEVVANQVRFLGSRQNTGGSAYDSDGGGYNRNADNPGPSPSPSPQAAPSPSPQAAPEVPPYENEDIPF